MGALAVIWPQSSSVLALHFGFSLLAFASTFLLVMALRRVPDSGMKPPKVPMPARKSKRDLPAAEGGGSRPGGLSSGTSILLWVTAVYTYVVVYLGAYVRHTDSSGGCGRDWPLCAGEVVPSLTGATGIMFIHRVGAVLLFVLVAYLMYRLNRETDRPDMAKAGRVAFQLTVVQVFSGALVTFALGTDSYLFASLLHTVIIAALFSTLSYLCALWVTGPQKTAAAL
ncbi:COX15/CtaA family protein [Paenibacillus sp. CC-CFT747]|nr:COX15/CtaA family protein [Paenibacillus sp. CC-CFT747]